MMKYYIQRLSFFLIFLIFITSQTLAVSDTESEASTGFTTSDNVKKEELDGETEGAEQTCPICSLSLEPYKQECFHSECGHSMHKSCISNRLNTSYENNDIYGDAHIDCHTTCPCCNKKLKGHERRQIRRWNTLPERKLSFTGEASANFCSLGISIADIASAGLQHVTKENVQGLMQVTNERPPVNQYSVQCNCCLTISSAWKKGDNPFFKHLKSKSPCLFLRHHLFNPSNREETYTSEAVKIFLKIRISVDDLVRAGFHYNFSDIKDQVRCIECNYTPDNWHEGDHPWLKHSESQPQCTFVLRAQNQSNIGDLEIADHSRHFVNKEERLKSFEFEITRDFKSRQIKIEDLVAEGFFYEDVPDRVCCYRCSLRLFRWRMGDNPRVLHAHYSDAMLGRACPLVEEYSDYSTVAKRLASFIPVVETHFEKFNLKVDELAELGLYFSQADNTLHCYLCDIEPRCWGAEEEKTWEIHRPVNNFCGHVRDCLERQEEHKLYSTRPFGGRDEKLAAYRGLNARRNSFSDALPDILNNMSVKQLAEAGFIFFHGTVSDPGYLQCFGCGERYGLPITLDQGVRLTMLQPCSLLLPKNRKDVLNESSDEDSELAADSNRNLTSDEYQADCNDDSTLPGSRKTRKTRKTQKKRGWRKEESASAGLITSDDDSALPRPHRVRKKRVGCKEKPASAGVITPDKGQTSTFTKPPNMQDECKEGAAGLIVQDNGYTATLTKPPKPQAESKGKPAKSLFKSKLSCFGSKKT